MRPAFSIIFFTTSSGLGLGLAAWIVLGLMDFSSASQLVMTAIITLGLIGAGLLSSTFHLGHPERAWRALSQWRSSWLSREGVLAVAVMVGLTAWFAHVFLGGTPPMWSNLLLVVLLVATVYATSMIYASLKTVARWHHPLTPVCYLMFAAAGGLLGVLWLLAMTGQAVSAALSQATLLLLASAWGVKLVWWRLAGSAGSGSSLASATGLGGFGEVRSLMPPHTSENYLQHEMGFIVARRHAAKLRVIALGLGAALPLLLVGLLPTSGAVMGVALASHVAGVMVERWLFFAEAKHVVSLYYGAAH